MMSAKQSALFRARVGFEGFAKDVKGAREVFLIEDVCKAHLVASTV